MAPVISRLILTAFILAHTLIHVAFLGPRPPATAGGPPWPFELGHSWILDPQPVGSVGSLALLLSYFHPWLLLGVAIDLGLIWSVLILGWTPQGL